MKTLLLSLCVAAVAATSQTQAQREVSFTSPGFPPSRLDSGGRLMEDWGAIEVQLTGESLPASGTPVVQAIKLDQIIPAAQSRFERGPVTLTLTAFRAPVWPQGLDVLTVRLEETEGRAVPVRLALNLPDGARLGARTVSVGGRVVMALPDTAVADQKTRDWGWMDDAVALPDWAKPQGECDPAFRNIRAGLGGVPIRYRFSVAPKARFNVVLGFCESHWEEAGQRPVICEVEGAKALEVDAIARWGQHRPRVVLFEASDANGDGRLEVAVSPKSGAPDMNPILNVLWIFPPDLKIELDQVRAGRLNASALHYVDVGGPRDQALVAGGRVDYALTLPARGNREWSFWVACQGGSVPMPERSAWTADQLRQAAVAVWRDWRSSRAATAGASQRAHLRFF